MNPTSEQVRKVAKVLRDAHARGNRVVDMNESGFRNDEGLLLRDANEALACGTIACHAGHYAIEKFLIGEAEVDWKFADYIDGAWMMASDLGFGDSRYELIEWARENPEIWGNEYGYEVFSELDAFVVDDYEGDFTLLHIAKHWDGVADRLEQLEYDKRE